MRARDLRQRVTFSKRAVTGDDYGNPVAGVFVPQFTVYARLAVVRGGEDILAEKLTGRNPILLIVRRSENTRRIDTAWRGVDANNAARVFNIRAVTPDEVNRQIELLCEMGVAV